jgi:2'-5' RNA ligase
MANLHRLFVAINLPEDLRKKLNSFQDKWLDLPARWSWPENLHITLVFLGNNSDQEVIDVCKIAQDVAKCHEAFEISLNKVCFGPENKEPRMVWAVGDKSAELGSLQYDLENAFGDQNYSKSENEHFFTPHVTLARIKQTELRRMEPEEVPVVNETINHLFIAESIEVMESELKRGGPAYTVLESFKLGE